MVGQCGQAAERVILIDAIGGLGMDITLGQIDFATAQCFKGGAKDIALAMFGDKTGCTCL